MKHFLSPRGSYAAIVALGLYFTSGASARAIDGQTERPIEARDAIEMTQMADAACPFGAPTSSDAVQFSPDDKHFFFVLTKGNLEQDSERILASSCRVRESASQTQRANSSQDEVV